MVCGARGRLPAPSWLAYYMIPDDCAKRDRRFRPADGKSGAGQGPRSTGAGGAGRFVQDRMVVVATALAEDFRRDLEDGRGFLWWPVAFGTGAALYFAPISEPPWWAPGLALFVALAAALTLRAGRGATFAVVLLLLAALGYGHAVLMTRLAAHPVLAATRVVTLKGLVVEVEDRGARGERLLIRPDAIEPAPKGGLPPLVRVSVGSKGSAPVRPGDGISMRARLGPPPPPVLPGAYDFARIAWFSGIGGTGFAYGRTDRWSGAPPPDFGQRLRAAIAALRLDVSRHIRERLPDEAGGIAAALIVGDRGGVDPATDEAMRIAGLTHILSISGLHMSLVAASLFWAARLLMALLRLPALDWPGKKVAAAFALAGTFGYFLISGMDVPAARSTIMVAVMLLAVMVDRRALSMRVIAVAALVTLALSPQTVMDPGAQMSFAAVLALLAGLEAHAARGAEASADAGDISPLARGIFRAGRWLVAAAMTTLIAGLATAPIALYHFARLSPLGMLANLVAEPLVSFMIMPAAIVSALAMPFGLDGPPLSVMGFGIDGMIATARTVAAWTPGDGLISRPSGMAMLLVVAGGLWLCLWRGGKRWIGLAAIAVGLAVGLVSPRPVLMVSGDGRFLLVDDGDGLHRVARSGGFEVRVALATFGVAATGRGQSAVDAGVSCDDEACLLRDRDGASRAAMVSAPAAFAEECDKSPLVVTPLDAPPGCHPSGLLLDGNDLHASGGRIYTPSEDGPWRADRLRESGRVIGTRPRPWLGRRVDRR